MAVVNLSLPGITPEVLAGNLARHLWMDPPLAQAQVLSPAMTAHARHLALQDRVAVAVVPMPPRQALEVLAAFPEVALVEAVPLSPEARLAQAARAALASSSCGAIDADLTG